MTDKRARIIICGGSRCSRNGSVQLKRAFDNALKKYQLENETEIIRIGCLRLCEIGPMVIIFSPEGTCYSHVQAGDVDELVHTHFVLGKPLNRLEFEYKNSGVESTVPGFYTDKQRVELAVMRLQNKW